jgi:pimeloyl-ACP methyl ester carboxylesterase
MRAVGLGGDVSTLVLAGIACAAATDTQPQPRHLIYLHGRIVQEQQSARPAHPRFGLYELRRILDTFRERGFVVSSEVRPRAATVSESADRVVGQVRSLRESGVSADRITLVGASMGAGIALVASARLQNPDLRFALLGVCLSDGVRGLLAEEGNQPSGHLLVIREASDELVGPCPPWRDDSESPTGLVVREIVLETGLSHGFLYRPLPEWVNPVVEWAERWNGSERPQAGRAR